MAAGEPEHGGGEDGAADEVLRKRQGVPMRVVDVGIEDRQGLLHEGMGIPRQRPHEEVGVGIPWQRHARWMKRQRIGHHEEEPGVKGCRAHSLPKPRPASRCCPSSAVHEAPIIWSQKTWVPGPSHAPGTRVSGAPMAPQGVAP